MKIKRGTNYISFVSHLETNGTQDGEFIEVLKHKDESAWLMVNRLGEKFCCPTATLRIFLDHASDVKMYELDENNFVC